MNLKPTLIIPVLALFILMLVPCVYGESPPAIVWQKVLGGSGYDQGNGIAPTSDDGAIAIGWTASSNSGDVGANHGGDDVWVIKLDSTGSVDWQKLFGGAGDDHGDFIEQTTDGGYIFIGETRSSDSGDVGHNHGGEWDIWVVKLDGSGTIQWQQLIGGSGLDLGKTIHQTSDGGYVLCGNQDWGGYIAKLNGSGGITWQKSIGQYNAEYDSVWPTADGGYILSGWTWGYNNPGGPSAWVTKTDGAGTVQWNKVL